MYVERKRILVAAASGRDSELKTLFERDPLGGWEPLFAESFARARFILQHNPCTALVVHEELLEKEGTQGLAWLAWKKDYPVVFLGESPVHFQTAFDLGVQACLPYPMAFANPALLATTLRNAEKSIQNVAQLDRTREQLTQTRKHVDRLVTLIWRSSPHNNDHQWYSQPYLFERLTEELARAERHKVPLSLALGEINQEGESIFPETTPDLLVKGKRRCDVVGQYGNTGFMLLMVHTPKMGGMSCCRRIQNLIETPETVTTPGPRPAVRAYFGLSTTHGDRHSPQSMLRAAEQNLGSARTEPLQRIVAD